MDIVQQCIDMALDPELCKKLSSLARVNSNLDDIFRAYEELNGNLSLVVDERDRLSEELENATNMSQGQIKTYQEKIASLTNYIDFLINQIEPFDQKTSQFLQQIQPSVPQQPVPQAQLAAPRATLGKAYPISESLVNKLKEMITQNPNFPDPKMYANYFANEQSDPELGFLDGINQIAKLIQASMSQAEFRRTFPQNNKLVRLVWQTEAYDMTKYQKDILSQVLKEGPRTKLLAAIDRRLISGLTKYADEMEL